MQPIDNTIPLGLTPLGLSIIGTLLLVIGAMAKGLIVTIWRRVFPAEEPEIKEPYVTQKELAAAISEFKNLLDEIKDDLAKGDDCFLTMEESVRTLAHVAYELCKVMKKISDEDLDCDALVSLIRRPGHGR